MGSQTETAVPRTTDQRLVAEKGLAGPRFTLALLLIIYVFAFIDRQIVAILGETLKRELDLQNWQLGMLTGLAFAVLYSTLALPFARYADKGHRRTLIAASVGAWSIFTMICGFTQTFAQLLIARVGVGVGEAGCTPASHSLITASTPRERRASALAIYAMGVPLGTFGGMAIGGVAAELWGWRAAFLIAGAPGVLLAVVARLTLREPVAPNAGPEVRQDPSGRSAFAEVASKSSFRWITAGIVATTLVVFGVLAFAGSFFMRLHQAEIVQLGKSIGMGPQAFLGVALGLAFAVGGLLGNLLAGRLADRSARRGAGGYLIPPVFAALAYIPLSLLAFFASDGIAAIVLIGASGIAGSIFYAPSFAAIHTIVRVEQRSTASAMALFALNLLGYGLGPLCVGILNDVFATQLGLGQAIGLRWALAVVACVGSILAAFSFWKASRAVSAEAVGIAEVGSTH